MNSFFRLLSIVAIALFASPSALLQAKEKSVGKESLGKITEGQKAEDLVGLLGKPASKGKVREMGATGEWVQEWKYPALGVRLSMGTYTKNGPMTVSQIWGEAGCKLATRRGIKIGDTIAAVRKAYGDVEDKSRGKSSDHFVAGSIYGGVFFDLKDGKVTQIFIGANAE
jgi:hypothetical protein